MRTSQTHPLQIAAVEPQPGFGRIGITFCPGKKQPGAMTGGWDRDLGLDLAAVQAFGAAAVLTLIEEHEMRALGVEDLGAQVAARHIDWLHLPIRDVSVPDAGFEAAWREHGAGIRARLRHGFNLVIHCKGGLGRAGMIGVRLMVELGSAPDDAMAAVRRVRPGAIETADQEAYARRQSPALEPVPHRHDEAVRDRAAGALLGLAVGDAVGTTLEFRQRDSYPMLTDMIGGGPFRLQPGQWTDDTAMALALADSLYSSPEFDPADLMRRFVDWRDKGTYSCTGDCFDIGNTTNAALTRWTRTGDPYAGATEPHTAGNGSLMRLAPVAIRFWRERDDMRRVAADQSRTTHGAPEAVSACVAYAELLADAIGGMPRHEVLAARGGDYADGIGAIMAGSWRGKTRHEIASSGYVAHSLEAALWSVARTSDFRSAILLAANLGGDADTTAAIAGQLAGAIYGVSGIPADWLGKLAWKPRIEGMALALMEGDRPA